MTIIDFLSIQQILNSKKSHLKVFLFFKLTLKIQPSYASKNFQNGSCVASLQILKILQKLYFDKRLKSILLNP